MWLWWSGCRWWMPVRWLPSAWAATEWWRWAWAALRSSALAGWRLWFPVRRAGPPRDVVLVVRLPLVDARPLVVVGRTAGRGAGPGLVGRD